MKIILTCSIFSFSFNYPSILYPFWPKGVEYGWVIKTKREDGTSQYDFQYEDNEGYKVTFGGLSRSFDKEFWNYAKLISGVLRHGMHTMT